MGTLSGDMEKVLVEQARNGDRAAMRQIYDCYSRYLAATCSRYLPDGGEILGMSFRTVSLRYSRH